MGGTAREAMTGGAECIGENDTLTEAARRPAELDVGAMPICGADNRLKGISPTARRLPVIDGHDLIGVVTQADLAKDIGEDKVGDLVEAISAAP